MVRGTSLHPLRPTFRLVFVNLVLGRVVNEWLGRIDWLREYGESKSDMGKEVGRVDIN